MDNNNAPVRVEETTRAFEGRWCDDGYDFIAAGGIAGWTPVSAWGVDGWDLLDWPYYVCLFRGDTERATYCEGDIRIETFESREARERSTDELALANWTRNGEPWVESRPAEDLRGPYRPTASFSGVSADGS